MEEVDCRAEGGGLQRWRVEWRVASMVVGEVEEGCVRVEWRVEWRVEGG